MLKAAIDTNVLLDFLISSRNGHSNAQKVFMLALSGSLEVDITLQSIIDSAYICRKMSDFDRNAFNTTINMLLNRVNVSTINTFELEEALNNSDPDIEDSAQIYHAWSEGCELFITKDHHLLSRELPEPLKAITPEEFLARCQ